MSQPDKSWGLPCAYQDSTTQEGKESLERVAQRREIDGPGSNCRDYTL